MQRLLLLFCCLATFGLGAQTVLADFEGDDDMVTWTAPDGTYNGIVANPEDTTGINSSANAGSYTKSDMHAYSLFLGTFDTPLDLTTNNQFSIQVYADTATSFILKLEGTGQAIEMKKNIATAKVWRTYTFDFSAAASTLTAERIVLFFDEGSETTSATYLIDNLTVDGAGPCTGTAVDPLVIEDFECQRNATYGVGYDDVEVVANPDKTGINTSEFVGEYTDQAGAYHALVISYDDPIDLSQNAQFCIKVWAPVAGNLLFKLEGPGGAYEEGVMINDTDMWTEACVDFSGQVGKNYTRFVLFFNAGQNGEGDVYYIDDITRSEAPAAEAIEDFEDGASLGWTAPGTTNGTFNGVIANPDKTGANTSDNVGSYTRGAATFSVLQADLIEDLDLSSDPQLNLDVWAPEGATSVTMQLVSATQGAFPVTVALTETMSWQTLNFNFEANAGITDFVSLRLLFNPDTETTGTYYFDNLMQGESTVDNCADVVADIRTLDDFECQRNGTYTVGQNELSVVDNPDDAEGGNTSPRVGQFVDPVGAFNALAIGSDTAIDLGLYNQFMIDIWAPVAGEILFKLEGGSATPVEVRQTIPATESWETYMVDFADQAGKGFTTVVIFFDGGNNNTAANTYYIDNIRFSRPAYANSCISTFDDVDYSVTTWNYFANGGFESNDFMVVDNPDKRGVNTSDRVGQFEEATDGETYAGLTTLLDAPVVLVPGMKMVKMKVWMEVAGSVAFKLEAPRDGAPNSGDVVAEYTTPGEWQELTFDMSSLPDNAMYDRISILMNNTAVPDMALTHYFDDITVGSGDCSNITGIFEPVRVAKLSVFPNPVTEELTIDNPDGAVRFTLTNMLGQQVKQLTVETGGLAPERVYWPVDELRPATYVLGAYDRSGRLVARSLILKR